MLLEIIEKALDRFSAEDWQNAAALLSVLRG